MNRVIVLLSLLLSVVFANAQTEYYQYSITQNDKIKRENIICLAIEKSGMLLVGTNSGLIAFDGNKFRILPNKKKEQQSPIRCIQFFSKNNTIELKDQFNTFKISDNQIELLHENNEAQVVDFQKGCNTNVSKAILPLENNIIAENNIAYDCVSINKDEAYFTVNDNLFYYNNNKLKNLGNYNINQYFSIGSKAFYITKIGKIIGFDKGVKFKNDFSFRDSFNNKINILNDEKFRTNYYNNTYYISGKKGLFQVTGIDKNYIQLKQLLTAEQVDKYIITCIAATADKQTLYVGTSVFGLLKFTKKNFINNQYQTPEKQTNAIYQVVKIGNTLFGGPGPGTGKGVEFNLKSNNLSFEVNDYNKVYFKTNKNELYKNDKNFKQIIIYDSLLKQLHVIKNRNALGNTFCEDSNGDVYFIDAEGIFRIKKNNVIECLMAVKQSTTNQIPSGAFIRNDTLWSINVETGLKFYDLKKNAIGYNQVLSKLSARFILPEPNGKGIFVCTYGSGIWYVCGQTTTRLLIGKNDIFNYAHSLFFDAHKRVWIPTNYGLVVIRYEDLLKRNENQTIKYYWHFTTNDNLISNEFNGGYYNSIFYDKQKELLYLPNMNGIVEINVELTIPAKDNYAPQIINIHKDNKEIVWTTELKDFNQLSGDIITPGNHRYQISQVEYRLTPNNTEWQSTENNEFIISRPKPGNHKLELRYRNGFNENDYIYNSYSLEVLPFWYERKLIRLLLIVLNIALLIILALVLTWRTRKRKRVLSVLVEQKTLEILREMKQVETLSLQNEMFIRMLTHDIKAPLNATSKVASYLSNNVQNLSSTDLKKYLQEVGKSTSAISQYIHHFLAWIKLRKQESLNLESTDIVKLLDDLIDYIEETHFEKGNKINRHYTKEKIIIDTHPQVLNMIISNVLDNALKYTTNGIIEVFANFENNNLKITISDNGIGMNKKILNNLLIETEFEIGDLQHSYKMGYVFIRDFIKLINGSISIESQSGEGTTVNLYFPQK
jgi:signal transduction histidine kinase